MVAGESLVCAWCGEPFVRPAGRGPVPRFCGGAHRQAAHRARVASSSGGVGMGAPLVDRLRAEAEQHFGSPAADELAVLLRLAAVTIEDLAETLARALEPGQPVVEDEVPY